MAGTKMVHVPYKGGAPAMMDLLAGQVQLVFSSAPTAVPQVRAGKIRGLAVTTASRSVVLPELPTIAEAGLPGFEADNWYGIVTVMKTPRPIVERLHAEIVRALHIPDVKQLLLTQGLEVRTSTPQEFGAYMKSESEKWATVIRNAGIVAN
jgi:tripartite-type tricarboxylate transporter receptor subunit TctC